MKSDDEPCPFHAVQQLLSAADEGNVEALKRLVQEGRLAREGQGSALNVNAVQDGVRARAHPPTATIPRFVSLTWGEEMFGFGAADSEAEGARAFESYCVAVTLHVSPQTFPSRLGLPRFTWLRSVGIMSA